MSTTVDIFVVDASEPSRRSEDFMGSSRLRAQVELISPAGFFDSSVIGVTLTQLRPFFNAPRESMAGLIVMNGASARVALPPTSDARAFSRALHQLSDSNNQFAPRGDSRRESNLGSSLKLALLLARRGSVGCNCKVRVCAFLAGPLSFSIADSEDLIQRLHEYPLNESIDSVQIAVLAPREELGLDACAALDATAASQGQWNVAYVESPPCALENEGEVKYDEEDPSMLPLYLRSALPDFPALLTTTTTTKAAAEEEGMRVSEGGLLDRNTDVNERIERAACPLPHLYRLRSKRGINPLRFSRCRDSSLDRLLVRSSSGLLRPWIPTYASLGRRVLNGSVGGAGNFQVLKRSRGSSSSSSSSSSKLQKHGISSGAPHGDLCIHVGQCLAVGRTLLKLTAYKVQLREHNTSDGADASFSMRHQSEPGCVRIVQFFSTSHIWVVWSPLCENNEDERQWREDSASTAPPAMDTKRTSDTIPKLYAHHPDEVFDMFSGGVAGVTALTFRHSNQENKSSNNEGNDLPSPGLFSLGRMVGDVPQSTISGKLQQIVRNRQGVEYWMRGPDASLGQESFSLDGRHSKLLVGTPRHTFSFQKSSARGPTGSRTPAVVVAFRDLKSHIMAAYSIVPENNRIMGLQLPADAGCRHVAGDASKNKTLNPNGSTMVPRDALREPAALESWAVFFVTTLLAVASVLTGLVIKLVLGVIPRRPLWFWLSHTNVGVPSSTTTKPSSQSLAPNHVDDVSRLKQLLDELIQQQSLSTDLGDLQQEIVISSRSGVAASQAGSLVEEPFCFASDIVSSSSSSKRTSTASKGDRAEEVISRRGRHTHHHAVGAVQFSSTCREPPTKSHTKSEYAAPSSSRRTCLDIVGSASSSSKPNDEDVVVEEDGSAQETVPRCAAAAAAAGVEGDGEKGVVVVGLPHAPPPGSMQ